MRKTLPVLRASHPQRRTPSKFNKPNTAKAATASKAPVFMAREAINAPITLMARMAASR